MCREKWEQKSCTSDIIETDAGSLAFRSVLTVALPTWTEDNEELFTNTIYDCLKRADARENYSVVVPTLGTEQFGIPKSKVAEILVRTVKNFILDKRITCQLDDFVICIEDENDVSLYLTELYNGLGKVVIVKEGKLYM